jgi:hypothetical protein
MSAPIAGLVGVHVLFIQYAHQRAALSTFREGDLLKRMVKDQQYKKA